MNSEFHITSGMDIVTCRVSFLPEFGEFCLKGKDYSSATPFLHYLLSKIVHRRHNA